jgi:hypothetical protein
MTEQQFDEAVRIATADHLDVGMLEDIEPMDDGFAYHFESGSFLAVPRNGQIIVSQL